MDIGVRELKEHLSRYLARVREGERIVVTDRGVPVARLEPLPAEELPEHARDLAAAGRLRYKPRGQRQRLPNPVQLAQGEKDSTDYVREQRR